MIIFLTAAYLAYRQRTSAGYQADGLCLLQAKNADQYVICKFSLDFDRYGQYGQTFVNVI